MNNKYHIGRLVNVFLVTAAIFDFPSLVDLVVGAPLYYGVNNHGNNDASEGAIHIYLNKGGHFGLKPDWTIFGNKVS